MEKVDLKNVFMFKMSEKLAALDPLGKETQYTAVRNPLKKDTYNVYFECNGEFDYTEFYEDWVQMFIEKGDWIILG